MFTITKYGENISLVVLNDELDTIKESSDPAVKKQIQGWLEHGFPVKTQHTFNRSLTSDAGTQLNVEPGSLQAFQEFLQNEHALDIKGN